MIRDLFFEVPNGEAADQLAMLCELEGWTVDREVDVSHYVKGEPFLFHAGEEDEHQFVPTRTFSSVTAHKPGFDYDEINKVHEKASELAARVGGECTGGGCEISAWTPPEDLIPWIDDAQVIKDYLEIPALDKPIPSTADMAMEIRALLVEAGWTPPVPVNTADRDALAAIVYRVNNPRHGDYDGHEVTAEAILKAGWTAPKGEAVE